MKIWTTSQESYLETPSCVFIFLIKFTPNLTFLKGTPCIFPIFGLYLRRQFQKYILISDNGQFSRYHSVFLIDLRKLKSKCSYVQKRISPKVAQQLLWILDTTLNSNMGVFSSQNEISRRSWTQAIVYHWVAIWSSAIYREAAGPLYLWVVKGTFSSWGIQSLLETLLVGVSVTRKLGDCGFGRHTLLHALVECGK